MRPAWETTTEANQPYRAPQQALADPNTIPYQRQPLQQELDMNQELAQLADRQSIGGAAGHADGREAREFGQQVMEMTGAPSWARGIDHLQHNQPGEAIPEFLMGALNTGSLATLHYGAGPARVPTRPPLMELPPQPTRIYRGINQTFPRSPPPRLPPEPQAMPQARSGPDAGPVQGGRSVGAPNEQARSGNILPPSPLDDMLREMNIDPMRIPYENRRAMEYMLTKYTNQADRGRGWLERYLMNTWDRHGGGEMATFNLPEGQRLPARVEGPIIEGELARTAPDGEPPRTPPRPRPPPRRPPQ